MASWAKTRSDRAITGPIRGFRWARFGAAAVRSALVGAAIWLLPAIATAQADPGLLVLDRLVADNPVAALDRIDEALARENAAAAPDIRVVFDLYGAAVEILIALGRGDEAAGLILQLAEYAVRFRATLEVDPAPLFARAAEMFEAAGQRDAARDALAALLEEQRAGARPAETIAATLDNLARLSDALDDGQGAAGYRAAAAAARDSAATGATRGDGEGFRAVDVYYATDRARSGNPDPSEFYGSGRGDLELGVATVTIPDQHVPGVVEAPSIWRLEFRANAAKHVVLQSVTPLDSDLFYTRLQSEFETVPEREAFVFVHGYNVKFDQAARRAAQIAYDMKYIGVPILYSWPSRGSTVGYVADTAVVRLSGRRLSRFLDDLVARSGAETIHIVAHSMGNRALTDALELMALRRGLKPGDPPVFGQVLFAAPDVDAGLFREMLPTIRPIARRLTLYASEADWALTASVKLHGDMPRAGIGGTTTLTDPRIDSIDMSELGEDMLSHSYFADDSSALADMMTLFWQNSAPQHRCGLDSLVSQGSLAPIWTYRRGVCADRSLISVLGELRREKIRTVDEARRVVRRTVIDKELAAQLETVVSEIVVTE